MSGQTLNKILVIQTASIGDVILATPIVEKMHSFYPNSKIDFLVKKGNESLFDSHPFLHKVLVWNKSKNKYRNLLKLITVIRQNRYDCVINVQRFASSGFITAISGAGIKIGFDKNPFSRFFNIVVKHEILKADRHEIDRNLELISSLTNDQKQPIKLYPSKDIYQKLLIYKKQVYITISPTSLWFTKQFPKEKWIEFINAIKKDVVIYLLGAPNDFDKCNEIIQESTYINIHNLAGKLSFLESAALMKDARMNFVNDSAPMHLSSSVNAPTTAIFCSTVPEFGFGPKSEDSLVVETHQKLDCRPCGLHGHRECPFKHFKCAKTIGITQLLSRI